MPASSPELAVPAIPRFTRLPSLDTPRSFCLACSRSRAHARAQSSLSCYHARALFCRARARAVCVTFWLWLSPALFLSRAHSVLRSSALERPSISPHPFSNSCFAWTPAGSKGSAPTGALRLRQQPPLSHVIPSACTSHSHYRNLFPYAPLHAHACLPLQHTCSTSATHILYLCRRMRGEQVCKKLVLAGASAGSQNLLGQTPLSLASHAETREYLRSLQSDSEQRAQEQFLQAAAATSEVV